MTLVSGVVSGAQQETLVTSYDVIIRAVKRLKKSIQLISGSVIN